MIENQENKTQSKTVVEKILDNAQRNDTCKVINPIDRFWFFVRLGPREDLRI
jgi:hypothetical protein